MEDRYGALTKTKDIFIKIVDSANRLTKSPVSEIRDEALMLLEFIKEYYMNYPLKGQPPAVTSSLFDELEFYSLQEHTIKKFHRNFALPRRRSASHSGDDLGALTKKSVSDAPQPSQLSGIHRVPSIEEIEGGAKHSGESGSARFYEMLKKASPVVMQYLSSPTAAGEKAEEKIKRAEAANLTAGELREVEDYAFWKARTVHLAVGTEAIISVIQSPYLSSRIIVRDLTGKHAWLITEHRVLDYNCLDTIDYNDKAAVYKNAVTLKGDSKLKEVVTSGGKGMSEKTEEEKKGEIALKLEQDLKSPPEDPAKVEQELAKLHTTDTLTRVLSALSAHCSDIKLVIILFFDQRDQFDNPPPEQIENLLENLEKQELSQNAKEISEFQSRASKVEEAEHVLFHLSRLEDKSKKEEEFKAELFALNKGYQTDPPKIDHARRLLCHLGNLDVLPAGGNPGSQVTLLNEADPDLRMLMKFLDNECALRRSIKLGVIYVERGQFDQKSILYNTKGSAKYEELLRNLGKPLSKKNAHKSLSLQPDILYYATAIYELVFHVITLMATNFNDAQQLEKKKYVGNDSVHIVWTENDREYKAGTITGAFNFAHLVVYPLRNGLYKVRIEKKKDPKKELVKFFGPIVDGMVLPMDILPALLRFTAINARKSITYKQLQMFNPMSERRKTIEKIVSKYAVQHKNKTDQQFAFVDRLIYPSFK